MTYMLHYTADASEIEKELERYAIAIGFNWEDAGQAKLLAMEFKQFDDKKAQEYMLSDNRLLKSKATFFGLANIMLKMMASCAEKGYEVHGGATWKAFAKEL